jgi:hypothetical protein
VKAISKAPRRSDRIRAAVDETFRSSTGTKQQSGSSVTKQDVRLLDLSNTRSIQTNAVKTRKRDQEVKKTLIEQPRKCLRTQDSPPKNPCEQVEKEKQRQEDEVTSSTTPFAQPSKRLQSVWKTISDARVDFWRKNTIWPTAEQERTMDCFRDLVQPALAKKRSLASRRQQHSDDIDTIPTRTSCDQSLREQKSTPYRHPRYERQLSERGSFMGQYKGGIGAENEMLCKKLLTWTQLHPKDTNFEDNLFTHTLDSIKSRNEARVIRDIAPLITPSAEILAIRGAQHLGILRETINAIWTNAIPFYGPRPQPDYGLGFKREDLPRNNYESFSPLLAMICKIAPTSRLRTICIFHSLPAK